jgi:hypothetical protein
MRRREGPQTHLLVEWLPGWLGWLIGYIAACYQRLSKPLYMTFYQLRILYVELKNVCGYIIEVEMFVI